MASSVLGRLTGALQPGHRTLRPPHSAGALNIFWHFGQLTFMFAHIIRRLAGLHYAARFLPVKKPRAGASKTS